MGCSPTRADTRDCFWAPVAVPSCLSGCRLQGTHGHSGAWSVVRARPRGEGRTRAMRTQACAVSPGAFSCGVFHPCTGRCGSPATLHAAAFICSPLSLSSRCRVGCQTEKKCQLCLPPSACAPLNLACLDSAPLCCRSCTWDKTWGQSGRMPPVCRWVGWWW